MNFSYIVFTTTILLIFSIASVYMTYILLRTIKRARIRTKLKKHDLNDFDIIFGKNGFPFMLVSLKNKNNLIYL
jgi:hypothetical protein